MREVILRPDAEADLQETAEYTIEAWGPDQALSYIQDLRRAIESLATTALQNQLHEDVLPGLRRKRSGMHHIYYLVTEESVEILSVIHVQRDPGLRLEGEIWSGDEGDG